MLCYLFHFEQIRSLKANERSHSLQVKPNVALHCGLTFICTMSLLLNFCNIISKRYWLFLWKSGFNSHKHFLIAKPEYKEQHTFCNNQWLVDDLHFCFEYVIGWSFLKQSEVGDLKPMTKQWEVQNVGLPGSCVAPVQFLQIKLLVFLSEVWDSKSWWQETLNTKFSLKLNLRHEITQYFLLQFLLVFSKESEWYLKTRRIFSKHWHLFSKFQGPHRSPKCYIAFLYFLSQCWCTLKFFLGDGKC